MRFLLIAVAGAVLRRARWLRLRVDALIRSPAGTSFSYTDES